MGVFLSNSHVSASKSGGQGQGLSMCYLRAGSLPKKVTNVMNEMTKTTTRIFPRGPMVADLWPSPVRRP